MALDKKTIMGLFIAAIMILSVMGFALTFSEPVERLEYNDYKFVRTSQGLRTTINDIHVYFVYFARDVADIPFDEGAKVALDGARVIWFAYDPNDIEASAIADALYRMEDVLGTASDQYVQRALLDNTGYALPQVSCINATAAVPVLILQSGNETKIEHKNGCITATADRAQAVYQVSDRILYQALGVMK